MQGFCGLYSSHIEVANLIQLFSAVIQTSLGELGNGVLDEKPRFSFEMLATAISGFQGMSTASEGESSNSNPVEELLMSLLQYYCFCNGIALPNDLSTYNTATINVAMNQELSLDMFAKLLFGVQRLNTSSSPALCWLLKIVSAYLVDVYPIDDENGGNNNNNEWGGDKVVELTEMTSYLVGNACFGLQGCDGSLPFIDSMLRIYLSKLTKLVSVYSSVTLPYEDLPASNTAGSMQAVLEGCYYNMIMLYRSVMLSLYCICHSVSETLYDAYMAQLVILERLVEKFYERCHAKYFGLMSC